jgi:phospholipid/cholesterol/gamma-HCH transport system substrate-binding protein
LKIAKEIKIGLVVVGGIVAFIWGFNYLKGSNAFNPKRTFYGVYKNVDGLIESNPVLVNGLRVGRVDNIELHPDNSGRIVVSMTIENDDIRVSKNSIAEIASADIMGSKAIHLIFGTDKTEAHDGDTLLAKAQIDLTSRVSAELLPIKEKAEKLIGSIDSTMIVVQAILDKNARDNLSKSFESIKNAISTFEQTSLRLDDMVASEKTKLSVIFTKIESISSNIAKNNDKLTNIINNFSSISDSLAKANIRSTIDNANKTLLHTSFIMEKINKGEGSMGMLINNDSLYRKLDKSSEDLDKLLNDIRINPERYINFSVFGKKYSKPKD